ANYFSERSQVRLHSIDLLCTAARNTETRDHLVKNKKRIVSRAFLTQDREEVFPRKIETCIGWDGLNNYCGDLIFVFLKGFPQHLGIVERQRDCEISERRRHTSAARLAMRQRTATGFHQERVCMPMITAIELDNLIASRECAREPDARHRRFRAAVHHSHFV